MNLICRLALALLLATAVRVAAAWAQPGMEPLDQAVCRLIEGAAHVNHLPVGYLTRIIWRESSFRPGVVSSAGAEGIAQFMPGTAQQRGLADPFDPEQAIPKAAHLLADLRRQFGSLGAAAAAYNAGSGRVSSWLRGQGDLPAVTRAYVRFVTQGSAEAAGASGSTTPHVEAEAPTPESCLGVTADLRRDRGGMIGDGVDLAFAPLAPWGVQLAGNFSKAVALASFERARQRYAAVIGDERPMIIGRLLRSRGTRPFYQVRLPAASRREAQTLCTRIQAVGGSCVAMHS
jgi:Transglycosylase SLT domain/SPOR domain